LSATSGMMRPIASMRWKCLSSKRCSGSYLSSALAKLRTRRRLEARRNLRRHVNVSRRVPRALGRGLLVEVGEHAIADGDRLFDVLDADRSVGDAPGSGTCATRRAAVTRSCRLDLPWLPHWRRDGGDCWLSILVTLGRDDLVSSCACGVRDDRVSGLDAPAANLGVTAVTACGSGSTMTTSTLSVARALSSFRAV